MISITINSCVQRSRITSSNLKPIVAPYEYFIAFFCPKIIHGGHLTYKPKQFFNSKGEIINESPSSIPTSRRIY